MSNDILGRVDKLKKLASTHNSKRSELNGQLKMLKSSLSKLGHTFKSASKAVEDLTVNIQEYKDAIETKVKLIEDKYKDELQKHNR